MPNWSKNFNELYEKEFCTKIRLKYALKKEVLSTY